MSVPEVKSAVPCHFCRKANPHLESCPGENKIAQARWLDGFNAAQLYGTNEFVDDATYTLGYVAGEIYVTEQGTGCGTC
jgi:hypothetical protein